MQSIFGTDGIRGIFNKEITCDLAHKIGYAFGSVNNERQKVLIGRDTRVSGDLLLKALSNGLNQSGKEVIYIGICPTPAIPFLIKQFKIYTGIMISASHNPPEYNGIKIFDHFGHKLNKKKEQEIESYFNKINSTLIFRKRNNIIQKFDLLEIYNQSLLESIGNNNLNGMKIILDTCHGSASVFAENVFKQLGASVYVINSNADGSKINVKCGSTCLDPLKKAIKEFNAEIGFSFDGDADRVIGIDSEENILDGDHILFLWGRELMREKNLSRNLLITTVMSNLGFEKAWNELGGILIRTPVGDKFIHEEINKQKADLGGEQSGHILSKINNYSGDGVLTAIQIANFCRKKNIVLKDLLKTSFRGFPQKLTNIQLNSDDKNFKDSIEVNINKLIKEKFNNFSEPCRIFARNSGTESVLRILVEAENKNIVDHISIEVTRIAEKIITNKF